MATLQQHLEFIKTKADKTPGYEMEISEGDKKWICQLEADMIEPVCKIRYEEAKKISEELKDGSLERLEHTLGITFKIVPGPNSQLPL